MSKKPPTALTVHCNIFDVKSMPRVQFFQYEAFEPEIKIARRRIELITTLQTEVQPNAFTPRALYDGKTILYSQRQLPLPGQGFATFEIPNTGKTNVRITLRGPVGSGPVDFSGLRKLFAGQAPFDLAMAAEINVLQLMLRQAPHQSFVQKGKSFYSRHEYKDLRNGIEIWRGFFQSIRPSPGRMVVNVDVSATTFYAPGNLISHSMSFLDLRDARDLERLQPHPLRRLEVHLKNLRVKINIANTNKVKSTNRVKTIKCLEDHAGYFEFEVDGVKTTVQRYYLQTYGITLRYPGAVGINLRPRNGDPTIIPMELCEVVPGQFYKKQLPPHLTDQMVSFTTMRPEDRKNRILSSTQGDTAMSPILQYQNSDYLQHAGLSVSTQMKAISGHVLATPMIMYGDKGTASPARGGWNVMGKKLFAGAGATKWAVVNFDSQAREGDIRNFLAELHKCCLQLGMKMSNPRVELRGPPRSVGQFLEDNLAEAEFILAILPKEATDIRIAVKQWGDVQRGIPTQCVRIDKIRRVSNQYCNNVALKINTRLGGKNCEVELHPLAKLGGPYMILGIDVSHPGAGVHGRPSIASLVFSTDRVAVQYQARLCVQRPRTESISPEDLKQMVTEATNIFGQRNRCGPKYIIVYRDGVSEGEYNTVEREGKIIRDTVIQVLEKITGKPFQSPKMTFIVVTKRHHVRFFPSAGDADKSGNCPAGFTTGESLSTPGTNEFYLQSHGGLLGTSRPSHYVVLRDEIFDSRPGAPAGLQNIQSLSYGLCHVYATATRSVSIPAPVYYADRACLRAAKFYLPPESDGATDGSDTDFDLQAWKDRFSKVNDERNRFFFL